MYRICIALCTLLASSPVLVAENATLPLAGPVSEPSTTLSLGMHWIVRGDDNRNAAIAVSYRPAGSKDWKQGPPLWRVAKGAHTQAGKEKHASDLDVPADGWLFAGSILLLESKTSYEVKLALTDPDGGSTEKTFTASTTAEPQLAAGGVMLHVAPGAGGGSGTEAAPFLGLAAAQAAAKPGARFLLHAGVYPGTFEVTASGEPGKPIVWQGPESGDAVIDAKDPDGKALPRGVSASEVHDVWFRKLAIRGADFGMVIHGSSRIVIQRCHLTDVGYGITGHPRTKDQTACGFFISDNILEGRCKWLLPFENNAEADAQWHSETRAIEVCGTGSEICYNRISHFKDAIDLAPSFLTADNDIHHNDVSQLIDDGFEMDGSDRNTRCFLNRVVDCHTGLSIQPVYGGPAYLFRNTLYNVHGEVYKMHNSPSGALFFHNTTVKKGEPFLVSTPDQVNDCWFRNNLFVGTEGRPFNLDTPQRGCDLDYDGIAGGSGNVVLKFDNVKYATWEEVRAKSPVEKHVVVLDPATLFASGLMPPANAADEHTERELDYSLTAGTAAIDAGEVLPGMNDGFAGKAPDLGAREVGSPAPHYGPRPEKK
ncbi:MAG: hypothetical protein H0W83_03430 [Planctomycetes bacterium]|nr:hypothetical protein [Planctomycetota bacterium]